MKYFIGHNTKAMTRIKLNNLVLVAPNGEVTDEKDVAPPQPCKQSNTKGRLSSHRELDDYRTASRVAGARFAAVLRKS